MKQLLSREEITSRILRGECIVIYDGHVLRIPKFWMDSHPGGSLSLLHFVGRDATLEIEAYHSQLTLHMVSKYSIGVVQAGSQKLWEPLLPPIAAGWIYKDGVWLHQASVSHSEPSQTYLFAKNPAEPQSLAPTKLDITLPPPTLSLEAQHQHALEYRKLHQRIIDASLYNTSYLTGYGPEFARYVTLAALSVVAYRHQWFMLSALFLGMFWHQVLFFAHDLGHMGVTHSWAIDRLLGTLVGNFLNGLSIGWWVNVSLIHRISTCT